MDEKRFGKNLKEIRECLDLSQADFAKRSGITAAALCMIEKGQREPSLSTIVKILNALGCSLERMLK